MKLDQFVSNKTSTKVEVFLGMTKTDGKWIWDDGTPVFVRCEFKVFKSVEFRIHKENDEQ